jgi:hypothetical protein
MKLRLFKSHSFVLMAIPDRTPIGRYLSLRFRYIYIQLVSAANGDINE